MHYQNLTDVKITPSVPQIAIDMQGAMITVPMAAYGNHQTIMLFRWNIPD